MITTVCKISYGSQTVPPIVPAVQGDTGRAISFEIADFTPPAGATATYFILKPSGEAIYNSATITDNSILCELTAQSLAEAGENRMQVRVLQGEDIVTSFEVILMVRTFLGDDAIESGTEMNIFDQAVEQATEQFQENAEQIVEEVIESIPEDYTELTEEVEQLNERIGSVVDTLETVNITEVEFTEGAYIATNKSETQIVDLTPVPSTGYKYAILDCKRGDRFELNGTSGSAPRLWAFLNVNNALICNAVTSLTANGLMITAPFGATKCVINNNDLTAQCFKWTSNAVDNSNIIKCDVVFEPSYYIPTNGATAPHTTENGKIVFTKTYSFYSACAIISCSDGQKIQITGKGGGTPRLWAFVNKNGDILSNSASGVTETNAVITAPQATAYCILNIYDTTLDFSATVFQNTEKTPDHGNISFSDGYITTVSVGSAVTLTPVSNSDYKCAVVPCVEGQTFTITGTTEDNSGRRLYAFADLSGYMRYREDSDTQLSNESITAPLTGNMIINVRKEFAYSASDNYPYAIRNPITSLPPSFMGSMAFKPMGTLSKGYICLMTDDGYDDGTHGLVQETIPLAIAKNVPFTFALMRNSDVCKDATLLAAVKDAVENHGCSIAQHGEFTWNTCSEDMLNTFFDLEKAFWDAEEIKIRGAVIPAHYTTELVKAVCGGRFGVVRSGYDGIIPGTQNPSYTVTNHYSYYTSGEQSNLYCLSSYNNSGVTDAYNQAAVDYAYANNKILICYFHENAMDSTKWGVVSDMIDYAKTKGLEFITLGDIPHLLNN